MSLSFRERAALVILGIAESEHQCCFSDSECIAGAQSLADAACAAWGHVSASWRVDGQLIRACVRCGVLTGAEVETE